ncbi:MAG: sigma-70 family RNA polymerase sigma factor [Acidobacteriota bacterium]
MSDQSRLLSTTLLLRQYRDGEEAAADDLIARYLPILRRWARGRLPRRVRDLSETEDLLQMTFLRALKRLDDFESERPGALLAYLRTILLNLVREEIRRSGRRGREESLQDSQPAPQVSAVERLIGAERLAVYEQALGQLPELKRNAVIMRLEFGMSYQEIAAELERPSANAARMTVSRALDDLAALIQT